MTNRPLTELPEVSAAPSVVVRVHRMHPDAIVPSYALPGDAGADLATVVDVELRPGQRAVVPTGVAVELPPGHAAFVHPRSGLAARSGLGLVNAPGTIDAGYRGEIQVIVINHDRTNTIQLRRGDRIAQLVIQRVEFAHFETVDALTHSVRGSAGHGSTGLGRSAPANTDPAAELVGTDVPSDRGEQ